MSEKRDGGPAFPRPGTPETGPNGCGIADYPEGGMTLRDWFAGQALGGMLADPAVRVRQGQTTEAWRRNIAASSYGLADAMLAERDK